MIGILVKLTEKYQVTVPKEVRAVLDLAKGNEVVHS